ncbi:unnamed protein product, partial [Polarella glacialis]
AWTTNMAIFSAVGAFRMRAAALIDWHERLQAVQEAAKPPGSCDNIMHIVILPNYKEDEDMLEETLLHIAASPLATTCIRIVLGMEAREGEAGSEKAERLIEKTKHLFADVPLTQQPGDRQQFGDVSQGTANRRLAADMGEHRARAAPAPHSEVAGYAQFRSMVCGVLIVGWALPPVERWHPLQIDQSGAGKSSNTQWAYKEMLTHYASDLAGLGTLLFELAGLTNQWLSPHMCFSSYSLTLILANHRFVAGWDADVVAEDHHMFCKCFFACLWEELDGDREKLPLKPKLKLSAIYLPAQGYLVESSEGYFQSCWARFQQARRHSQGVAELGYVLLQYIKLLLSAGPFRLSLSAHYKICAIMGKMFTVHIVNSVQAFALIVAGITTLPLLVVGLQEVLGNVFKGNDFSAIVAGFVNGVDSNAAFTAAKWSLLLAFGAGLSTDAAQQEQHQQQWSPP